MESMKLSIFIELFVFTDFIKLTVFKQLSIFIKLPVLMEFIMLSVCVKLEMKIAENEMVIGEPV